MSGAPARTPGGGPTPSRTPVGGTANPRAAPSLMMTGAAQNTTRAPMRPSPQPNTLQPLVNSTNPSSARTSIASSVERPRTSADARPTTAAIDSNTRKSARLPQPPATADGVNAKARPSHEGRNLTILDVLEKNMKEDSRVIFPRPRPKIEKRPTTAVADEQGLAARKDVKKTETLSYPRRFNPPAKPLGLAGTGDDPGHNALRSSRGVCIALYVLGVLAVIALGLGIVIFLGVAGPDDGETGATGPQGPEGPRGPVGGINLTNGDLVITNVSIESINSITGYLYTTDFIESVVGSAELFDNETTIRNTTFVTVNDTSVNLIYNNDISSSLTILVDLNQTLTCENECSVDFNGTNGVIDLNSTLHIHDLRAINANFSGDVILGDDPSDLVDIFGNLVVRGTTKLGGITTAGRTTEIGGELQVDDLVESVEFLANAVIGDGTPTRLNESHLHASGPLELGRTGGCGVVDFGTADLRIDCDAGGVSGTIDIGAGVSGVFIGRVGVPDVVRLRGLSAEFGDEDAAFTFGRPANPSSSGQRTFILGQSAFAAGSGALDGGDVHIDGGSGGGTGNAGSVVIGDTSSFVTVGPRGGVLYLRGAVVELGDADDDVILTRPSSTGAGRNTSLVGQNAFPLSGTNGGDIRIDGGEGSASAEDGSVYIGTDTTANVWIGRPGSTPAIRGASIELGDDDTPLLLSRPDAGTGGVGAATSLIGQNGTVSGGTLLLLGGFGATNGDVEIGTSSPTVSIGGSSVLVGDSSTGEVVLGRAGATILSLVGTTITVGDDNAAVAIVRPEAASGAGRATRLTGQSGASGSAGNNGGDVQIDAGSASAGGSAGLILIGDTTASQILVGRDGTSGNRLRGAQWLTGETTSAFEFARPATTATDGFATTIAGQSAGGAGNDGGDLVLNAGSGSGTDGRIVVGASATSETILGAAGQSTVRLVGTEIRLGDATSTLSLSRPSATTGAGASTHLGGQAAGGAADANGGDLTVDAGAPVGTGTAGTVFIGSATASKVELGRSGTSANSLRGIEWQVGDTATAFELRRRDRSSAGGGTLTTISGQAGSGAGASGGNLVLEPGVAGAGGTNGMLLIGSLASSVEIGATGTVQRVHGVQLLLGDAASAFDLSHTPSISGGGRDLSLSAQSAAVGSGGDGGDIRIDGGDADGSGDAGSVRIGTSSLNVEIGASGSGNILNGASLSVGDAAAAFSIVRPSSGAGVAGGDTEMTGQNGGSGANGGDLILDAGTGGTFGGLGGTLRLGESTRAVAVGSAGSSNSIAGVAVSLGDNNAALILSRPVASSGNGRETTLSGQDGATGGGATTGGNLDIEAGSGQSGGSDGTVRIGTTVASQIAIGNSGIDVSLSGATLTLGDEDAVLTIQRPASSLGAGSPGTLTAIVGQDGNPLHNVNGGDLQLDGGAPGTSGSSGRVLVGTASNGVDIGQAGRSHTLHGISIALGDDNAALSMSRPEAAAGNGRTTTISGQDGASATVTSNGGDLVLEAGAGGASGTAGIVRIGEASAGVQIGQIGTAQTLRGLSVSVGDAGSTVSIGRPATSDAAGNGFTTTIIGQAASGSGTGGLTRLQGGAGGSLSGTGGVASILGGSSALGTGGDVDIDGGVGGAANGDVNIGQNSNRINIGASGTQTNLDGNIVVTGTLTVGGGIPVSYARFDYSVTYQTSPSRNWVVVLSHTLGADIERLVDVRLTTYVETTDFGAGGETEFTSKFFTTLNVGTAPPNVFEASDITYPMVPLEIAARGTEPGRAFFHVVAVTETEFLVQSALDDFDLSGSVFNVRIFCTLDET